MDAQDAFVERAVRFQKLATVEQIARAKEQAAAQPGQSLLDALVAQGTVRESDARTVLQLYEKTLAKGASPGVTAVAGSVPAAPKLAPARSVEAAAAAPRVEPGVAAIDAARVRSCGHLHDYLALARDCGASDLHINVGAPPVVRQHRRLLTLPREPFTPEETERLLFGVLDDEQRQRIQEDKVVDFCYAVEGQGRYRSCILKQRVGWDGAFRVIQSRVPSFQELGLPSDLKRFTEFPQGLVLVSGPSGCGKSTTMSALVELINQQRDDHIVTIEDPIEFNFTSARAHVNQREVGRHTASFAAALRAALREDPDVVVIGELRDMETVSLAVSAAETGHLVLGTMHTTSAARTIDRIIDVFPPDDQPQIRAMISESMRAIICQQLLPRKDGRGLALALEVLVNTPAVGNMIRERKLFQMPSVLQTGRKQGMRLLDVSLLDLVNQGVVEGADAYFAADNKGPFEQWAPRAEGITLQG